MAIHVGRTGKAAVLAAVGKVGDHMQEEICSHMEVQVDDSTEEQANDTAEDGNHDKEANVGVKDNTP